MGRIETKFKQTEVGLVPEDWEVKDLGLVGEIKMGHSPLSQFYNNKENGLPLIQGNADIENRVTIIRNYTSSITKVAKKDEIILSVRAPVGEVSRAIFDCCIGRGVCAIKSETNYLYHFLIFIEKSWSKFSTGSTFDSVNSNQLKAVKIALPRNKAEQTAIANALSDADLYIESLEKLIAKKQKIKQGAMQQLLKPKPHWEVKKLGEVIHLQGGYAFKSELFTDIGIPIIRISNIDNDLVSLENSIYYKKFNIQKEFIVKKGDALIAMSGATTGKIGVYNDEKEAYINQRVGKFVVLDDKKYSYEFVSHIIRSKKFLEELFKQISQGAQPNISGKQIEFIELSFPKNVIEQKEIAQTLSDIDSEITAITKKLTKAKAIKQGMMQQLLTGKIRLI